MDDYLLESHMKVFKGLLVTVALAGILLGIVYNLFLGLTPVWLDKIVAITVGIAVLIAVGLSLFRSKHAAEASKRVPGQKHV